MFRKLLLALACAVPAMLPAGAQSAAASGAAPLSTRVVAYAIEARLDAPNNTVHATETLTWRNLTGRAIDTFPFHLYLNAFQPKSTLVRELYRDRPLSFWREKNRGSIEIKSLEVAGAGDLTREMRFIAPDDGNPDDRTVFEVRLPHPVAPGSSVQFRITFIARLPEILMRTGYKGDFFMVAQWFPKVGVWWRDAWNCHQFHSTTEFFADFGTYDVRITLPRRFVAGATADLTGTRDNPDGTRTLAFRSEDVHDFAWTASPNFQAVEDSWKGSAGPVRIRILMAPEHMRQAGRYLRALKGTLDLFDRWYGPYPYGRITVVDPPHGAGAAGGMEYPTLITAGTAWWLPRGLRFPELVVEHEFGHQYWYGMVATNEFEDAWLDEGVNSYTEVKIMERLYGAGRSAIELWGATASEPAVQRASYLSIPDTDPLSRSAYLYRSGSAYGAITYGKTATVLLTLEGLVGEEVMRRALHTWFTRYRFTHPTEEDFLSTIEEVSGQKLGWFFDQAVFGTQVLDYAVDSIYSEAIGAGDRPPFAPESSGGPYRSSVVLRRKGDFIFPVEVEIRFANGERLREHWDGRDRWRRFSYEKRARLVSAEIDPEHRVWLDKDFFNNSRTTRPDPGASRKIAAYWLFITQFFAQVLAWLA